MTADSLGNYHFYIKQGQIPFTVQIYGPQVATPFILPDQSVGAGIGSNNVFTGTNTFTGLLQCKNFESIRCADQFPGADIGAMINAADADLGTGPGEIWVPHVLSGTSVSTAITIHSGHVLRFIQGGYWTFTAPITVEQGGSIIGSGGLVSSATISTGTLLFHNFNGDFIIYNGAATGTGTIGGGVIRGISIYNIYAAGDLNGNAIVLTGTALNNRANSLIIDAVYVDGNSATNRWTRGLLMDGCPIGGTQGIRDTTVINSRFHSSGTNNEDIRIQCGFGMVLNNVKLTNSANGTQTTGMTITGSAGNLSTGVQLVNMNMTNLVIDFASAVQVNGGFYSSITNTANTSTGIRLFPGNLTNNFVNNGSVDTIWSYGSNSSVGQLNTSPMASVGGTAGLSGTGACATITTQVGGAWAGSAKCTGVTGASTLTITPGTSSPNGWTCSVQDITTRANLFQQTSYTATTCVLTITSVTQNDIFVFSASAF